MYVKEYIKQKPAVRFMKIALYFMCLFVQSLKRQCNWFSSFYLQNVEEKDVYVCESRYTSKHRAFKKMKVISIYLTTFSESLPFFIIILASYLLLLRFGLSKPVLAFNSWTVSPSAYLPASPPCLFKLLTITPCVPQSHHIPRLPWPTYPRLKNEKK